MQIFSLATIIIMETVKTRQVYCVTLSMRKGGTYFKVLTYHHTQAMSAVFNKVDQVAPVLWLPSVV